MESVESTSRLSFTPLGNGGVRIWAVKNEVSRDFTSDFVVIRKRPLSRVTSVHHTPQQSRDDGVSRLGTSK